MDIIVTSHSDLRRIVSDTLRTTLPAFIAEAAVPDQGPKTWLTNKEAMQFLGLSKATLQRYRTSGKLPFSKIGSNVFYRLEDVTAMLEDHLVA